MSWCKRGGAESGLGALVEASEPLADSRSRAHDCGTLSDMALFLLELEDQRALGLGSIDGGIGLDHCSKTADGWWWML